MKKNIAYILLLLTVFSSACNKNSDTAPANNNEVNATVLLSSGTTININAKGLKAKMGCTFLGGGNFIDGMNDDNAAVYISNVYGAGASCVTSPGTYNLICEYRKNITDPNTPIWRSVAANRGSITFTTINNNYMEGSFNAVSKCSSSGCGVFGVDSVIITGTFKGNF